jgi:pimeloyl-ACP methyl ester carboxylesterase
MKPTIVLVHGAFADGSSWDGVIERLQRQGYTVEAPAIALRGVGADSAYLESVVKQIDGPVLLVGHSYGGALISNAATKVDTVIGLVFVAAFAPDTDEILGDVAAESKDSTLMTAQVQRTYPTGKDGETAPEFLIDPAKLREVFAADIPEERTTVMAATQRPVAAAAFTDRSGPPAWKSLPSWAVVATADKAAGTDLVRSMARRAGAETTEIESSHVVMISQPQAVTDVIVKAARAVAASDR